MVRTALVALMLIAGPAHAAAAVATARVTIVRPATLRLDGTPTLVTIDRFTRQSSDRPCTPASAQQCRVTVFVFE